MDRDYSKVLFSMFSAESICEGLHEASGKMPLNNQVLPIWGASEIVVKIRRMI